MILFMLTADRFSWFNLLFKKNKKSLFDKFRNLNKNEVLSHEFEKQTNISFYFLSHVIREMNVKFR